MISTDYYVNRDIDAKIMLGILHQYLDLPTDQAEEELATHLKAESKNVSLYKHCAHQSNRIGQLRLLLLVRSFWSPQGAFDDCTHWIGSPALTND